MFKIVFEIVFEIAGAKLRKSDGEKLLRSCKGLKILRGHFRAFFELFVSLFVLEFELLRVISCCRGAILT